MAASATRPAQVFFLGAEFTQALTNFREGTPPKKPGITAKPKEA